MIDHVKSNVAAVLLLAVLAGTQAAAQTPPRTERLQFAPGASSAAIHGQIKGYEYVDYVVRAGAGQTLSVKLNPSNGQNYFNVLPPGSKDTAMFIGQMAGAAYSGMLPADGDHTIRVYLMRAAARRNEVSKYSLTVSVTGAVLAPLPAAKDAVLPGTSFHASTTIDCVPAFQAQAQKCQAFVVRRGFDGTATVEVRGPKEFKRRVLFVKGQPVASDAVETMSSSRTLSKAAPDMTVVKFGADERYDIPDVLLTGG